MLYVCTVTTVYNVNVKEGNANPQKIIQVGSKLGNDVCNIKHECNNNKSVTIQLSTVS